jgi:hypothetical protein
MISTAGFVFVRPAGETSRQPVSWALGNVKKKVLPTPTTLLPQMLPPCASTTPFDYLGRAMQDWIISRLAERGSLIVE